MPTENDRDGAPPNKNSELPEVLDYSGEFGPELTLFLPFCAFLSKIGRLKKRRISTYRGMRCFYDDLNCLEIIEKPERRVYVRPHLRPDWLPVRNEHDFDGMGRPIRHFYPDLRSKFSRLPVEPEITRATKPLLIVHNKYNLEWSLGPINFISLEVLDQIFQRFGDRFTIVYIRHGISDLPIGFSADRNVPKPFADRALLDRHPEVLVFDDLFDLHRARGGTQDVNTFKNALYSRCYHFMTSQGGGAAHIALYSGSLMAVMHRYGREEHWGYGPGLYGFMADVPPVRAICRTDTELAKAIGLFEDTDIVDGRVFLASDKADRLRALSPFTITQRPGPTRAELIAAQAADT